MATIKASNRWTSAQVFQFCETILKLKTENKLNTLSTTELEVLSKTVQDTLDLPRRPLRAAQIKAMYQQFTLPYPVKNHQHTVRNCLWPTTGLFLNGLKIAVKL